MARNLRMSEAEYQEKKRLAVKGAVNRMADNLAAMPKPPKSKYGNKKTFRHGITFDSQHEADVWDDLLLRLKAGEIRNLQRQVSFPLTVDGKKIQTYRCDFWYWEIYSRYNQDNRSVEARRLRIADAKSPYTAKLPAWIRTKALFEACYGIEITVL